MLVKKGTKCVSLCCDNHYIANKDFEPKTEPLVLTSREGEVVYLRGKCFPCLLRTEIAPELLKEGIIFLSKP